MDQTRWTMATRFTVTAVGGLLQPGRAVSNSMTATASADDALATIECDATARRVVSAVLAGDRDAFAILVERELPGVIRVCYRVLGDRDDAEEAAQEAFVSAYRSLPAWRGDGPFGAWIARIAFHIAVRRAHMTRRLAWIDPGTLNSAGDDPLGWADDGSQRQVARHLREASVDAAPAHDPAQIAVAVERATIVREALAALEEPYRETVALRYFAELTVPEIASACDRPQGTVKTHLHRGLLRLRDRLDAAGYVR